MDEQLECLAASCSTPWDQVFGYFQPYLVDVSIRKRNRFVSLMRCTRNRQTDSAWQCGAVNSLVTAQLMKYRAACRRSSGSVFYNVSCRLTLHYVAQHYYTIAYNNYCFYCCGLFTADLTSYSMHKDKAHSRLSPQLTTTTSSSSITIHQLSSLLSSQLHFSSKTYTVSQKYRLCLRSQLKNKI